MSGTYRTKDGNTVEVTCTGIEFYKVCHPKADREIQGRCFTCTKAELQGMIARGAITKVEG